MKRLGVLVVPILMAASLAAVPASPAAATPPSALPPASTGAFGWGWNQTNEANGMGENVPGPQLSARGEIPASATITSIHASGSNDACAIADGKGYCWGQNSVGQLGNGDTMDSAVPVAVDTSDVLKDKTIVDMAISDNAACALTQDDLIACWGYNNTGQAGNGGTTPNSLVPVLADQSGDLAGKDLVEMASAFTDAVCVLDSAGQAYCWGPNGSGAAGGSGAKLVPTAVDQTELGSETFASLGDGVSTMCGISTAHKVYCWGKNSSGEIGDGSTTLRRRPTAATINSALGADAVSVTGGWGHTCAVRSNGEAACWGDDTYGQLGNGNTGVISDVPVAVSDFPGRDGRSITDIQPVDGSTCLIVANEDGFCWGYGGYGALGTGNYADTTVPLPVLDASTGLNGAVLTAMAASDYAPCAVSTEGAMYCWGWNSSPGYLANGSSSLANLPAPVYGGFLDDGETWTYVQSGESYACGITSLGHVWCWGNNDYGQLGDNSTDTSYVGRRVQGDLAGKTVTALAVGPRQACALTSTSAIYCWGSGTEGALGNNSDSDALLPVAVDATGVLAGKTITAITGGDSYNCALDDAGTMYCWGYNISGQLGIGGDTSQLVPVAVSTAGVLSGKVLTAIDSEFTTTCALDDDGHAYCWGTDHSGSLGNGTAGDSDVPTAVDLAPLGGKVFSSVETGYDHTCGISEGSVFCWGANDYGQLGTGDTTPHGLPTAIDSSGVLNGKTVADLEVGAYTTCVLDSAGAAYCWGYGNYGSLGTGNYDQQESPAAVKLDGTLAEGAVFSSLRMGGADAAVQAILKVAEAPEAPTGLTAKAGDRRATISFTPGDPGTSPISNYDYSLDGGAWTALSPDDTTSPVTITGLTNGTAYSIRLRAVTDVGPSPASAAVSVTPKAPVPPDPPGPTGKKPGTPSITTILAGSARVAVTVARASGGASPTGFRVTAAPGGRTCAVTSATGGSCAVTGLTNGTTYTFTAVAINASGTSGASDASERAQPGAVKTPSAQPIPNRIGPGGTLLTEGGVRVPATVIPNSTDNALGVEGRRFTMGLASLGPTGHRKDLLPGNSLELLDQGRLRTRGEGFMPGSQVRVYADPEVRAPRAGVPRAGTGATYAGMLRVGSDGSLDGTVRLPESVAGGVHDLQLVGVTRGNLLRVLSIGVMVADVPGKVRELQVESASAAGRATLTWRPPAGAKLAGIDGYRVAYRLKGSGRFFPDGTVSEPGSTVRGLIAGCSYVFRVRAVNSAGTGGAAYTTATVIPSGRAGLPAGDVTCRVR